MSTLDRGNLDSYLVDKSSVLCALSIRQIQLKRAGLLSQRRKSKSDQNINNAKLMRQNRICTLTTLSNLSRMFFKKYISYIFRFSNQFQCPIC